MQERFEIGWQLLVLGMGTVFIMLYLLSVVVKYMGKYFTKNNKQQAVTPEKKVIKKVKNNNDKIAAVMAAIQVVMGGTDYQVISIKPKGNSTWKQSNQLTELTYRGRKEN